MPSVNIDVDIDIESILDQVEVRCTDCDRTLDAWRDADDIVVERCDCMDDAIRDDGYESGYDSGYESGYDSGYESGYNSGHEEGTAEGSQTIILREVDNLTSRR